MHEMKLGFYRPFEFYASQVRPPTSPQRKGRGPLSLAACEISLGSEESHSSRQGRQNKWPLYIPQPCRASQLPPAARCCCYRMHDRHLGNNGVVYASLERDNARRLTDQAFVRCDAMLAGDDLHGALLHYHLRRGLPPHVRQPLVRVGLELARVGLGLAG